MSYFTIKHIKGHPYLYEVHSERDGDSVRQVFDAYWGRADSAGAIERRPSSRRARRAEARAKVKRERVPFIPIVTKAKATKPEVFEERPIISEITPEITLDEQLRTFEAKQKEIIPTSAEYVEKKMAEYKETTLGLGMALDAKRQRETLKREYKVLYPAVTETEAVSPEVVKEEKPITPKVAKVKPIVETVTPLAEPKGKEPITEGLYTPAQLRQRYPYIPNEFLENIKQAQISEKGISQQVGGEITARDDQTVLHEIGHMREDLLAPTEELDKEWLNIHKEELSKSPYGDRPGNYGGDPKWAYEDLLEIFSIKQKELASIPLTDKEQMALTNNPKSVKYVTDNLVKPTVEVKAIPKAEVIIPKAKEAKVTPTEEVIKYIPEYTSSPEANKLYESLPISEKERLANIAEERVNAQIKELPEYKQLAEEAEEWNKKNRYLLGATNPARNKQIALYMERQPEELRKAIVEEYPELTTLPTPKESEKREAKVEVKTRVLPITPSLLKYTEAIRPEDNTIHASFEPRENVTVDIRTRRRYGIGVPENTPEFTPQDFDIKQESNLVTETINEVDNALEEPNMRRAIKSAFHVDWTSGQRPTGKASVTVILTDEAKDVGMGSAGEGSAKVFWSPYSNRTLYEKGKSEYGMLGVDPIATLAHEYHHALGGEGELDIFSDAIGAKIHLRHNLELVDPKYVKDWIWSNVNAIARSPKSHHGLESREALGFAREGNPTLFDKLLSETGYSPEALQKVKDQVSITTRKWKSIKKSETTPAEIKAKKLI